MKESRLQWQFQRKKFQRHEKIKEEVITLLLLQIRLNAPNVRSRGYLTEHALAVGIIMADRCYLNRKMLLDMS